jgi:hypothetical protein
MLSATDPVYAAINKSRWREVAAILSRDDYTLPYQLLTSLCAIGTCADERGFIVALARSGDDRLYRCYGPENYNLLHIALIFGNEYQQKAYHDILTKDQWANLCSARDRNDMTPIDIATHIINNIVAEDWDELKRNYFVHETDEFWGEFDFSCWREDCIAFLTELQ